ncbi:MAG: AI-2E family transporter YdiK [Desulfuromonadales bacterium]|nr:AI-2E family transporter YdiK [Desulfuromonadales bacterium]
MSQPAYSDLARKTLAILFLAGLFASCFWIMRPFLPATIWAAMIVIATWPLMLAVERRLNGKRKLATAVMVAALLLLFIIPCFLAIGTLVENSNQIVTGVRLLETLEIPPPPDWVIELPMVGEAVDTLWREVLAEGPEELTAKLAPFARKIATWLASQAGSFGVMLVHFCLTVAVAAVLYLHGEKATKAILQFCHRLGGERGEQLAVLAAQAVRAVALGVVVTAFVQSVLAGIGMAMAGLKFATLLTALIFILGVAQIGAFPVLIPCVAWLFWKSSIATAVTFAIWATLVGFLDNFMRPMLIKRGANLPLALILVGVVGGLIAFGFIGLFIGPVVLGVSYTLAVDWIEHDPSNGSEAEAIDA